MELFKIPGQKCNNEILNLERDDILCSYMTLMMIDSFIGMNSMFNYYFNTPLLASETNML